MGARPGLANVLARRRLASRAQRFFWSFGGFGGRFRRFGNAHFRPAGLATTFESLTRLPHLIPLSES